MSTDPTSLLPVRYYGSDPDTIEQEILDELRANYGEDFTNIIQSSHGMMLIHLYSRALWRVVFQGDRNASDVYAHTVRMRTPSAWIAKQLGYNPRGAAAAATALNVSLQVAQAFDVLMPSGFVFKASDGSLWRTSKDYQWDAGDATLKSVSVREFELKGTSFTSNGQAHQRFKMPIDRTKPEYIVDGSLTVRVAGVLWDGQPIIRWGANNDYEVFYTADVPFVMFGDGSAGNIPPQGAAIRVEWEQCRGLKGNIGNGNIASAQAALVVNGVTIGLDVTQPAVAGGGLPDESAQEAARSAVTALQARGVAVTRGDIEAQALAFVSSRYGRAARATAHSPRGGGNDAVLAAALKGVRDKVGAPVPAVAAAVASLSALKVSLLTAKNTISSNIGNADADLINLGTDADQAKTAAGLAAAHCSTIQSLKNDAEATLTSADLYVANTLTVGHVVSQDDRDALDAKFTTISNRLGDIYTEAGGGKSDASDAQDECDSVIARKVTARADLAIAKAETSDGSALDNAVYTTITADTGAITAAVTAVDDEIEPYLQAIYDHVDMILASDAKANVVQVPILAKDQDGFLVAPTVGLTKSIEAHLIGISEPTVSIEVTDGSLSLIVPAIKAYGWFSKESVETEVKGAIQAVVDQFVQGATFGTDLCLRDLYEITRSLEGLVKVTFEITGPPKYLDAVGNLVVPPTNILARTTVDMAGLVEEPTT